ncbi:EscU/YscU/HrcU family type III secretion system export apparatus switch protein [Candidatus Aerophobetes bacterium]|uniref:EscU/YscU/HrcU family type III secretion system export apparatus switch protein n=1 Tax=Aerophobetes bacterium TaxID=2030807 RepID=A0A2A4X6R1_UNCAE|nr:MAG: EscU/YscU/HrcU family type III secretion system export apparatus switch protein [Candidatus Aerophobetes bacterium]
MAEKTEQATPKKLRDARKKGQVAKSKDFPSAFTFATSFALIVATSGYFFKNLAGFLITCFKAVSRGENLSHVLPSFFKEAGQVIFTTSMPFMVLISIVGIVINFLIVGPMFSLQAMKPDIKKLNPVTNLKNMFKIKTFIELLKSIFKISGAIVLIYSVISSSLDQIIGTAAMPMIGAAIVFSDFLVTVAVRVGIFFLAIAIFDLVFQKKNFAKEMKMEKFEVKQEMKDTEGNPELKGKRRQLQQEVAYQESPNAAGRARAIVTNPIHIAIALSYDEEEDPAPKIIVMGKGITAENIIKVGLDNNVPIMRNVTLAQDLYNKGKMGHYVPEDTYEAIAEVLKWLNQLQASEQTVDLFK